jgi:Ribonuclease G/E
MFCPMTVLRASRVETGDWQIDPAELHRVFPPAGNAVERRKTALEEQIKDLRQVSELLHDVRATGIMYETQSLAVRALRELLDNPDRDNWDEILAANRALIKAIAAAVEITTLRQKLAAAFGNGQ